MSSGGAGVQSAAAQGLARPELLKAAWLAIVAEQYPPKKSLISATTTPRGPSGSFLTSLHTAAVSPV